MATLQLPIHIEVEYTKDGSDKIAHVLTRDFKGRADCKIGNFYENWYIRPRKALRNEEWRDLRGYKISISKCLTMNGYADNIMGFFYTENIDGVEYKIYI